jgi:tRNA pseudouridine55 synthase
VIIDKPAGWTSHQVVGRVRRLLGTRKVGHAGTLDPMATGVLVIGVNRATRLLGLLALHDKAYAATIRLGVATLTDDAEGELTATPGAVFIPGGTPQPPGVRLDSDRLAAAMSELTGDFEQVPSAVSAVKVGGLRSYARVRSGATVTLAPRPVRVARFEVRAQRELTADGVPVVDLDVDVECSTGTYVRALARDLGQKLGTGGHLTRLRRLRSGPFTVAEAQPLTDDPPRVTALGEVARRCFPTLTLNAAQAAAVRHGRPLPEVSLPAQRTALLGPDGDLLALYTERDGGAWPEAVLSSA